MSVHTTDRRVLDHIQELVDREHQLLGGGAPATASPGDELESIRVELDQCWDLLRQRRARREFGQDPDAAEVRPPEVVESYEQ